MRNFFIERKGTLFWESSRRFCQIVQAKATLERLKLTTEWSDWGERHGRGAARVAEAGRRERIKPC